MIRKEAKQQMTIEQKIQIIRNNFLRATEDFGFEFESPFSLTDGLEVFGYIPNYGSENGAVIYLDLSTDSETDQRIHEWCRKMECFRSTLSLEFYATEYKRSYFREMLRDWGKF